MIRRSDKTTLPVAGGESVPPSVEVGDSTDDIRRFQKQLEREQRATLTKHIAQGVAALVSFGAVLHTLVGVVESYRKPPEKPTVRCPAPEDTPEEPYDGVCQRLKRAELKAKAAQADAAECFAAKARTERALNELTGEVQDVESRLPKRKRVTNSGD